MPMRIRNSFHPVTNLHCSWMIFLAMSCSSSLTCAQSTTSDPDFDTSVRSPAYTHGHPMVVIDEAHHNFHTMHGRYEPLARILQNDGYNVVSGTVAFTRPSLKPMRVLLVSNARGGDEDSQAERPAFTKAECDAVEVWVRDGGSLLLIADHKPFGGAAYDLAFRFGVEMGRGFVFDVKNSDGDPTFVVYSEANGLLGNGPVIRGRNEAEGVHRIVAFTGQSLSIPSGAMALMKLAPSAYEVDSYTAVPTAADDRRNSAALRQMRGRAQGVALTFGKGRVIIVGEAALFSAQVLKWGKPGEPDMRFGMNAGGNDDKQFVLNSLHWLSGAIN